MDTRGLAVARGNIRTQFAARCARRVPDTTTTARPHARFHPVIEKILERDPAEELARAFQLFDDDHTGRITLKNLKKIAREIDEDIDEDELADMIHEFDRDGDGEINQEEFYELMRSEL